jgi:putative transposase
METGQMTYSLDLRKRVIEWVELGRGVTKASKIYKVSRATIYRWLEREELEPTKVERRKRKIDWDELKKDVEENPDQKQSDRAKKFGVRPSAISYAFQQMKITRKKKSYATEKEVGRRESTTIEC